MEKTFSVKVKCKTSIVKFLFNHGPCSNLSCIYIAICIIYILSFFNSKHHRCDFPSMALFLYNCNYFTESIPSNVVGPEDQLFVVVGEDAVFNVESSGVNLEYEWQTSDNLLPISAMPSKYALSNDDRTLTIKNVQETDASDSYFVEISNNGGTTNSRFFELRTCKYIELLFLFLAL